MKRATLALLLLFCITTFAQPAAVGDLRDGGVVFWVNPADNTHGLVCALSDSGIMPVNWGCVRTDLSNVPNVASDNNIIPSGPGAEIGDGLSNTNSILNDCPNAPAALAARSNGPEWFLPSIKELNEIFLKKDILETVPGVAPFVDFYFSSTENEADFAIGQIFSDGFLGPSDKERLYDVRAVRAF